MAKVKKRADVLLFEQKLFSSRSQAQRAIMAGEVLDHNRQRIDKPGEQFPEDEHFFLKQQKTYVSRGGFKLAKALKVFDIDLSDKVCLDIGASTGGFTDVALEHGAKLVYALDVGYNQLAWQLREDPRVIVMEKQNFRFSKLEDFHDGQPDFAMTDVSFISLNLIFPPMYAILKSSCDAVCLIKPQFEAGKENVGKHGIVRDPKIHEQVIKRVIEQAVRAGFDVLNMNFSPIKGGEGNIEFLIHLRKPSSGLGKLIWSGKIDQLVGLAHEELKR